MSDHMMINVYSCYIRELFSHSGMPSARQTNSPTSSPDLSADSIWCMSWQQQQFFIAKVWDQHVSAREHKATEASFSDCETWQFHQGGLLSAILVYFLTGKGEKKKQKTTSAAKCQLPGQQQEQPCINLICPVSLSTRCKWLQSLHCFTVSLCSTNAALNLV